MDFRQYSENKKNEKIKGEAGNDGAYAAVLQCDIQVQ